MKTTELTWRSPAVVSSPPIDITKSLSPRALTAKLDNVNVVPEPDPFALDTNFIPANDALLEDEEELELDDDFDELEEELKLDDDEELRLEELELLIEDELELLNDEEEDEELE